MRGGSVTWLAVLRRSALLITALTVLACGERFEGPASSDAGSDASTCIPTSCAKLGAECGVAPNGCGETVQCGDCPTGETCGGGGQNKCGSGTCTPVTCQQLGASCGVASDGCGATLYCGDCALPETCGGAGKPNSCGCIPAECGQGMCGSIPDGCGGTLECGKCSSGQICGGGGENRCGDKPCTPKTCVDLDRECGPIGDGCNAVLTCGVCASPNTCGGGGTPGKCGCTPKTCAALGLDCGQIDDGCGKMIDCGTCTAPETCKGGGTPNVCGCTPRMCNPGECGIIADGCGGSIQCEECTGGYICDATTHQCAGCVANVCANSKKCLTSQPCDGTNYIQVYCPCSGNTTCQLTGECL
ncbi:MAG: hypothetical protein R3B13_33975 [Polyangiaceae bacterium]